MTPPPDASSPSKQNNTIFLSYARADDTKPPEASTESADGWVTFFWKNLRFELTDRGAKQAVLWLDRYQIEPAEAFTPQNRTGIDANPDADHRAIGKLGAAGVVPGRSGAWCFRQTPDGSRIVSGSDDRTVRLWNAGMFAASLEELVEKAEKLCPLSLEERRKLRLVDPQAEATQKPLTPNQRRACGEFE